MEKYLNIKGTNLEKDQLNKYITQIAEEHIISKKSDKDTYPIGKLKENFETILETYEILNEHLKYGIKIHSAGEWLLDNFYIIEETVKNIEKNLKLKQYEKLPGIATGKYKGFARIYVLASEIVAFANETITEERIIEILQSYQTRKILSMEEIWNIGIFLQIAIIQTIADISKKIYYSQIQKYKVENIFERVIESKPSTEMMFQKKIKNNKNLIIDDLNYSFIEYMIYKLRRIGKRGSPYIEVLEKQVNKLGIKSDEVVKKEHLYVATLKIKMGTCITSIRVINRINFQKVFEKTNKTEELLNEDPSGIFKSMTEDTKEMYREKIKEISNKLKISEIYITEEILKLSIEHIGKEDISEKKKSHVGYYLIDDGIYDLKERLLERKISRPAKGRKQKKYIWINILLPIILDLLAVFFLKTNNLLKIVIAIILYVPIFEITSKIINYILSRIIKPRKIPKINLEERIGKENQTMVVIPTIVGKEEKIKEMFKKIEIYHLANQDDNLFFTLLGDCTTSDKEVENIDEKIIKCGKEEAERLNKKYNTKNKFNFLYRKRRWNPNEEQYLGWERKRGLLLQFNDVLLKQGNSDFIANTLIDFDENIKYVITLDADTNLILDSAHKMIGAMAHILNKPELGDGRVVSGYGIMQPRVGITLEDSQKTMFTKIFACNPGIDFYTNGISDVYQDCFNEGIFTGKGIYDLETYQRLIKNKLPENKILSHDLLEGNYLRCGLLSDVVVLDSFPTRFLPYLERENRWIRGDWQIAAWLEKKVNHRNNPINKLSKFKIFDNLRRSVLPIAQILLLLMSIKSNTVLLTVLILISLFICGILEIINKIIFRKSITEEKIYADKQFYRNISGIRGTLLRNGLEVSFLPTVAWNSLKAIIKTLYRLKKNKKLLEWKTSEFIDKTTENTLECYCKKMIANIIFGIIAFGLLNPFAMIIGTVWILAPYIAWTIGLENKRERIISEKDKEYLIGIAKETWKYFDDNFNAENNYLVPDNAQVGRRNKFVNRTSSTNIGLEILAIISAYDLKFISLDDAKKKIEKLIEVIINLDKWNGHLYNWYNIQTLRPLKPEYVSTVDSGNFVGYLYVLKNFLTYKDKESLLIEKVNQLIENTDFKALYSFKNRLFSIGFDVENNKLTDSYYDFLASEARQASFVAIAKKDVKYKHWANLSRTLTSMKGYKGLISWSGTAFEYLMPNLVMKLPEGSLIDEACKFARMSQTEYAHKNDIPWGISESAYSLKDLQSNYQYKAFGVPNLGLKRGLEEELVVSPYSTFLFLEYNIEEGIRNLKELEKMNMRGEYGFFDSIDFTKERLGTNKKYETVKTFMAHHQGLILNSINNIINKDILKLRFMNNPEIQAVEILLNERMPETVVLSKEKGNILTKGKYVNKYDDKEIIYTNDESSFKRINAISSDNYTSIIDTNGRGYSKYNDIQINRNRNRIDDKEGIGFFFKNMRNKKIWSTFENDEVRFTQYKEEFLKREENIETQMKVFLVPDEAAEIRQLTIKNKGILKEEIEVYGYLEPLLSDIKADIAHPSYNNMFLKFEYENGILIASRKIKDKIIFLGVKLLGNSEREIELEIEKEKFWGRNYEFPKAVIESSNFTNEVRETVEPIIALKTKIEIEAKETQELALLLYTAEDKDELIKSIESVSVDNINSMLELAKAKSEEEIKFLEQNAEKIENNQKILGHVLEKDIPKTVELDYKIENVWKFGISGDYPIILVEIKNVEEIYVVEELLETIEFFNVKNIRIDLCILNKEKISYETFVKEEINESIKNHRLEYLRNNQIFVFNKNELSKEDIDIIETIACITINGEIGGLKNNLDEIEKIEAEKFESEYTEDSHNEKIEPEEVIFDNTYGGFKDNEYIMNIGPDSTPPRAWSNIIANKKIGTVVTENSGGFTWINNSRLNRITTWENDAIKDFQTETVIIKDINKKHYWKLGSDYKKNSYQVRYGPGFAKYIQINNDIVQENHVFIPIDGDVKINHITLKNRLPTRQRLVIYYALNLSMGEERNKNIGRIRITRNNNFIICENTCKSEFEEKIEVTCSLPIKSYTNKKRNFFNEKMEAVGVNKKELKPEGNIAIENEVIIEIPVELEEYERKTVNIILGKDVGRFFEESEVEKAIQEVEKYWNKKTEIVKIKTPSEKLNVYMNTWLIYQTIISRIKGRTGYYQSGGAIGFRDQLQDTLGMKWIDINLLETQIEKAAKHQFIEGDVMHWWHEENKTGIRTTMSDDLLWLPYSVLEYIEFTGNMEILDKKVEYTCGIELEGEDEKYDHFKYTEEKESIFEHCMKAIYKALNIGENGFPKIGTGDWNDGFSMVGKKGKGESIWLGFFIYDILNRWDKILEYKGKETERSEFEKIKNELKKALNQNGWDGAWYKRAINDEGKVIGSSSSKECKIDSIAQSWSVISEAGNNDKKFIALDSAKKYLVDEETGIIKLLTPAFKDGDLNPGYIMKYPEGVRENGGQYTHAAIWLIMAMAKMGLIDEAVKYIEMINPISHTETKEKTMKYKIEPYVLPGDIYSNKFMNGRGGWSWYTGSSSWYYKVCLENILGITKKGDKLYLPEKCPSSWEHYEIQYRYKSNLYNIRVTRKTDEETEKEILVNGEKTENNYIILRDENKIENIDIKM